MSKYGKEIDYIVERIETGRGPIVSRISQDVERSQSKSINQIVEEAPSDLDREIVDEMFNYLIEIKRITIISYDREFMVFGSSDPIKNELIEYSDHLS